MQIAELSTEMSISLLTRLRFGDVACTKSFQPYVVPIFYAYFNDYIYSSSTPGQKLSWMRDNYEELSDSPNVRPIREMAYDLLRERENWWEPGLA